MEAAVSWAVEFLNRENGAFLHSPESCLPLKLSWHEHFGCKQALITCPCEGLSLKDWQLRLGQDVRVYDEDGRLAWWGYLNSVRQRKNGFDYLLSLDQMANRVAVRFKDLTGDLPGEAGQTSWQEDLESQSIYGIKERLLHYGSLHPAAAAQVAVMQLKSRAWPLILVEPRLQGMESEPDGWVLDCRGWMHTLAWRVWPGQSGLISHNPVQAGTQALGDTAENLRVAQSFLVPDSLEFINASVRARRQGSPSDLLKISLQADLAGKPSGLLLTSQTIQASLLASEAYSWIEMSFGTPVTLNQGQRYWLILERTGSVDPNNHFYLGVDENLGFADGSFLIYDQTSALWESRQPGADLIFRLSGIKEQADQMADVVSWAGQFLSGFETDTDLTTGFPPVADLGQDCLQVFNFLMGQGDAVLTPLVASVSPSRRVQISCQPAQQDASLLLEGDGKLTNPFGQPLQAPWQAVGRWLKSDNNQSFYLDSLELEPLQPKLKLNPDWTTLC